MRITKIDGELSVLEKKGYVIIIPRSNHSPDKTYVINVQESAARPNSGSY